MNRTVSSPKFKSWLIRAAQCSFSLLFLLLALLPVLSHAQTAVSCDSLAQLALPNTTITMAQVVDAGQFKMPARGGQGGPGAPAGQAGPGGAQNAPGGQAAPAGQARPAGAPGGEGSPAGGPGVAGGGPTGQSPAALMPAFCRVAATLKPSSDSDIKIEVWLPVSGWNGKFVGIGNGGTAGSIPYGSMMAPLSQGYALAATDTGHTGNNADFAVGHPEKMIDYSYRADHEMTVQAKAIVAKFFGKPASSSIWVGCSLGGVEALIEAKRYPKDYDGIVAGAPPNPLPLFNAEQIWGAWLSLNHPEGAIPSAKFAFVHQAALKACGTPVGLAQGIIEDPERCVFNPDVMLCKGDDAPDCLTAPQVERLKLLYRGPVDPRTNEVIFPGPSVGAENDFAMYSNQPVQPPIDLYRYMVYQDPKWDWKTLDYAASVDKARKEVMPLLGVDADLSAYLNGGGKLMFYIGWTEGHNANDLIKYYKNVVKSAPGKAGSVRLFANPGMNHCGGGSGCDTFEKLGTMDQWLASGKAPEVILSSKVQAGKTIRTRPLCAYPAIAKYKGTGSMDEAASFDCVVPK